MPWKMILPWQTRRQSSKLCRLRNFAVKNKNFANFWGNYRKGCLQEPWGMPACRAFGEGAQPRIRERTICPLYSGSSVCNAAYLRARSVPKYLICCLSWRRRWREGIILVAGFWLPVIKQIGVAFHLSSCGYCLPLYPWLFRFSLEYFMNPSPNLFPDLRFKWRIFTLFSKWPLQCCGHHIFNYKKN